MSCSELKVISSKSVNSLMNWPFFYSFTPLVHFSATFGQKLLATLNIKEISAEAINLTAKLFEGHI